MKSIKVAHIVKSSHNIGEGALINGMHASIRDDISLNIVFDCIDRKFFQSMHGHEFSSDSLSKRFDISFAKDLNKNYDLIIFGGGGVFQTGEYDNLGGMAIAGDLEALNELKIPWVVYGVGDNRFNSSDDFEYGSDLSSLIEIAQNKSKGIISFRNDLTKDRLKSFVSDKLIDEVFVIPDPGLYINPSNNKHPLIRQNKKNIILNLAGDRTEKRLSIKDDSQITKAKKHFISQILNAVELIAKEFPINVIIAPHIPSDYSIVLDVINDATKRKFGTSGLIRELFDINHCTRGYEQAGNFFSLYSQADLAIVMRGHGAICSAGIGTPFISIDAHPKVSGFMHDFDLENYSISPSDKKFSSKLHTMSIELLSNNSIWIEKRDKRFLLARETTRQFNRKIAELL
jgi:polysaccharide pyruvyl transferase WcaK-like protein